MILATHPGPDDLAVADPIENSMPFPRQPELRFCSLMLEDRREAEMLALLLIGFLIAQPPDVSANGPA